MSQKISQETTARSPHHAGRPGLRCVLLLALAILLSSCRAESRSETIAKPRANVLIVLVDTLRVDHLSAAGYAKPTSPGLEQLAERGVFFDHFYTHSAITRPSVATLLTSRYMSGHGVLGHSGHALPGSVPYLPELLRDRGFSTAAFVTSPQIHPQLGFSRGYDQFTPLYSADINPAARRHGDLVKVPADRVLNTVRQALADGPDEPFFYYVHLQDPHGPYEVSAEEAAPFFDDGSDAPYEGAVTGAIGDFGRLEYLKKNPRELAYFKALYDAEIARTDRALLDFVGWLDAEGVLADTHLVVTADHGEELLEHGRIGHSYWVHEELLRIPLLWIGPGVPQGRRVDALAGLIDLVPTVFDVLGLEPPEDTRFAGRSLRPLWTGDGPESWREALFVESVERRPDKDSPTAVTSRALVTRSRKIVGRNCPLDRPECESMTIFSLDDDPGEMAGRSVEAGAELDRDEREMVLRFRREMEAAQLLSLAGPAETGELPAEDVEKLRALGYVD